jgi:hypothetical protein
MNETDIVEVLIGLPRSFNIAGTKSISSLLTESGYCDYHDRISELLIASALSHKPELINEWLAYSEDKRASSGWYIKQDKSDAFIVGDLTAGGRVIEYHDKIKWMEWIRNRFSGGTGTRPLRPPGTIPETSFSWWRSWRKLARRSRSGTNPHFEALRPV